VGGAITGDVEEIGRKGRWSTPSEVASNFAAVAAPTNNELIWLNAAGY